MDNNTKNSQYRADIQGLRALAVMFVLIFHILPNLMPSGYLGVDVFFVISGFLITSLLLKEYEQNKSISLINFYRRRVLRIFPATVFTALIVVIITFIMIPEAVVGSVFRSAQASLLAITNFYFYKLGDAGDYWNPLLFRPLLHLWSLAVEEQFYLVFPLLFIVFIKNKRIFLLFLIILFIASLVISSVVVLYDKNLAYYMPYTRAFGLLH